MTQWQCEFRGQIRALTQWLKNMEMRLPPLEPRVSLVYCLDCLHFKHSPTSLPSCLFHFRIILGLRYWSSFTAFLNETSLHFNPTANNNQCNYSIQQNHSYIQEGKKKWWPWTNEACWWFQTLLLFDHHEKRAKDCASYLKVCHTQPDTEVVLLYSSTPAGETSLGHRETEGLGESGSIVPGPDSQAGEVLAVGGPLHRWAHTLKGH